LAPDAHTRELGGVSGKGEKKLELALPSTNEASYHESNNAGIQSIVASGAAFYSDSDEEEEDSDDDSDDSDGGKAKKAGKSSGGATAESRGPGWMDEDHRLLLRCTRPLLQSQNAGVVMAVAALHFYLSPAADLPKVVRALVFTAHGRPEVRHVVIKNICTMVTTQPILFQSHFNAFFVTPRDPLQVRAETRNLDAHRHERKRAHAVERASSLLALIKPRFCGADDSSHRKVRGHNAANRISVHPLFARTFASSFAKGCV
jgi:AP-3 complex subunit beta